MSEMKIQEDAVVGNDGSVAMGNNLLLFLPGTDTQDRKFIKDSLCWAEYQADRYHHRRRDPAAWFERYSGELWSVGWSLEHAPVIVVDRHFSGDVLDAWAKSVANEVSRVTAQQMKETFQKLEHEPRAVDLVTASSSKWGDFRFLPARRNVHNELEIVLSNVRLLSLEWNRNYFFWNVPYSATQLDIQSRRFVTTAKEIKKHSAALSEAVAELRFREIQLSV